MIFGREDQLISTASIQNTVETHERFPEIWVKELYEVRICTFSDEKKLKREPEQTMNSDLNLSDRECNVF